MSIVLHDYWRSSAAYRVRIALGLKGLDYRRVAVDLTVGDQRAAPHLALNPQGLVPALEIDGLVLTQSLAIIEYLDQTRPEPPLLPADAAGRARVRALALAIACDLHPLSNLRVLNRVEALAGPEARAAWNRDNIAQGLAAFEALLAQGGMSGRYCHGDRPGIADCTLIPQLYNASRWGVDWAHLPRIAAVAAACAEHPAFLAARPEPPSA
ncbi:MULTISPECIES: maleylacetoacetate isomerase [unclassified Paracoccus (in: a-proteobacteria)]|uniref:maleylacetoacetate isomerase n=1 Tax=unclassified Paracoccus (in: a-proteobacteria) TaxID=2688777 RepID=UPI0012B3D54C|nr:MULTISPECIES: maleylacetoacetate isomerase [unclassified Paracoccus (in: a-proteobacteria)]UXU76642.1 maleylacetoacetate isomerase [Paracoccus sp. SMMA_5]UXU82531.1 maleylacetoacetate isomerase [Paracoccus sp. SMMA_5_TC]